MHECQVLRVVVNDREAMNSKAARGPRDSSKFANSINNQQSGLDMLTVSCRSPWFSLSHSHSSTTLARSCLVLANSA